MNHKGCAMCILGNSLVIYLGWVVEMSRGRASFGIWSTTCFLMMRCYCWSSHISHNVLTYVCPTEMRPLWYPEDDIPFDKMWADDRYWFPLMLQRKLFKARFLFEGHETIVDQTLHVVDDLKWLPFVIWCNAMCGRQVQFYVGRLICRASFRFPHYIYRSSVDWHISWSS